MVVQYGNGPEPAPYTPPKGSSFAVECYKFKPTLADDIKGAALVISHAGAGTCLEVLEAGRSGQFALMATPTYSHMALPPHGIEHPHVHTQSCHHMADPHIHT